MKRIVLLALMLAPAALVAQTAPVSGYCNLGAGNAKLSGLLSTNFQQTIIPSCTVTVFLAGTTTKATLFSDNINTPLSNPFTATSMGAWLFFATSNAAYDVTLSGGVSPNTYPSPQTIPGLVSSTGASGCPIAGCAFTGAISGTSNSFSGTSAAGKVAAPQVNNSLFASQYQSVAAAQSAITACPTCIMRVDAGSTLTLIASTTLSGQWDLSAGGTITRGNFPLTFTQVPLIGSDFDLLDPSGTGPVSFPSGTGRVNASWFGASPLVSDNTNALNQAAISAALSGLPLEISGGGSSLPVTGQLTFNGVNTIRGNGPQGTAITTISTSYTAGCAIQIQNAFDAYVAGISLTYSVFTGGLTPITTASGICPETWRRGNMEHVSVTGAYSCLDTSQTGGQTNPTGLFQSHIDDFKCYNFTGHGMFLNKPVGSGGSGTISSNLFTNVRFDNHNAPAGTTPIDFVNLTAAQDNHFDLTNYQDTILNGTGPAFFMGSDVDNTQVTNQHIEANTFACSASGSVSCSFYAGRGSTTLMADGITFRGNTLNIANIPGGKWTLFQAEQGGNFFRVRHVTSLQNTLTGMVSTPVFSFFESGAAGTGDATLSSYHILDSAFTVAAYGNYSPSTFKDYLVPSQWPLWFYGVNLSAGDSDQTVDCNRPDHSQVIDYQTAFTGNHTLTLVSGTGYSGCRVQIALSTAVGSTFSLTVQDDASHTIGTFVGSQWAEFVYTGHAVQWQIAGSSVLGNVWLTTPTFEGSQVLIKPQTSASLGVNVTSPSLNLQANYWDSAASQTDIYTWRNIPTGTGNNPATVLTLTTGGSAGGSSGGHSVSFGATMPVAAGLINSNGATQTAANITASTGWGTSGAAGNGISGVSGSQRFRFTVTAAGTPAANPTIVATLPVTFLATPICTTQMVGGTGTFAFVSSGTATTTSTGTMTYIGTPVAGSTYTIVVDCRL